MNATHCIQIIVEIILGFVQCYLWIWEWHPLQHSCLENSMGRGAWQATVHGIAKG